MNEMPRVLFSSIVFLACASTAQKPLTTPASIQPPAGQLLLRAAARGAQIYTCKAKAADGTAFEWVLLAPDAELFDGSGAKLGRHFAGPTWENNDGSRVVGETVQRSPVPGAIPWLLLRAKSTEGAGAFAHVQYVQRIDTVGGVAPAAGCDAAHAGAEARVEYSANYDFYGAR
jgi:hypothetical protein